MYDLIHFMKENIDERLRQHKKTSSEIENIYSKAFSNREWEIEFLLQFFKDAEEAANKGFTEIYYNKLEIPFSRIQYIIYILEKLRYKVVHKEVKNKRYKYGVYQNLEIHLIS